MSSCLLGAPCRYDGGSKPVSACLRLADRLGWQGAEAFAAAGRARWAGEGRPSARGAGAADVAAVPAIIPICPELLGGLPCPRVPAERRASAVVTADGRDVTRAYADGAARSRDIARAAGARLAILKAKSPACGSGRIHDGSFSGRLVAGDGVAAEMLKREGFTVVDEKLVEYCEPTFEHPVAIVLGSGLGSLADRVRSVRRIPYDDIEGFPDDAVPVEGHRYEALVGTIDGVPVVVYPGRVHLYQGYSALEVTSLVRHAHRLGCHDIILTCASGAVGAVEPGTVGIIRDQMNLTGVNPLASAECVAAAEIDVPFISMAGAYSSYLSEFARSAAYDAGVSLAEGVYAGLLGPSYETPAEVRALSVLGADYVGMSTVCEAIMARALGMQILGLTLVTNKAGRSDNAHDEVLAAADRGGDAVSQVILGVLRYLGGEK